MKVQATKYTRIKKIVNNVKFALSMVRRKIMVRIYGKYHYARINRLTDKGVWVSLPVGEKGRFVEKWINNRLTFTADEADDFYFDWIKNHERRLAFDKTHDEALTETLPSLFFDKKIA